MKYIELALLLLPERGNGDWMGEEENEGERGSPQCKAKLQVIYSCDGVGRVLWLLL